MFKKTKHVFLSHCESMPAEYVTNLLEYLNYINFVKFIVNYFQCLK